MLRLILMHNLEPVVKKLSIHALRWSAKLAFWFLRNWVSRLCECDDFPVVRQPNPFSHLTHFLLHADAGVKCGIPGRCINNFNHLFPTFRHVNL